MGCVPSVTLANRKTNRNSFRSFAVVDLTRYIRERNGRLPNLISESYRHRSTRMLISSSLYTLLIFARCRLGTLSKTLVVCSNGIFHLRPELSRLRQNGEERKKNYGCLGDPSLISTPLSIIVAITRARPAMCWSHCAPSSAVTVRAVTLTSSLS